VKQKEKFVWGKETKETKETSNTPFNTTYRFLFLVWFACVWMQSVVVVVVLWLGLLAWF
jgi:hypothetical protein